MQPRDGGEVGPRRLLHGVLMVIVCNNNILLLYDVVEKSLLMVEDCGHGLENIYWPLGCGDRRLYWASASARVLDLLQLISIYLLIIGNMLFFPATSNRPNSLCPYGSYQK